MIEKEKQIEEIAEIICGDFVNGECNTYGLGFACNHDCESKAKASRLYDAGYRKQYASKWIPSPDGINPIRCLKCGMPAPFAFGEDEFGGTGFYRYPWGYCPCCGAKMKGGDPT